MKKLLIPALLLAAASSYGTTSELLTSATGARLTDYTNWFAPQFNVASDANYIGVPYPRLNIPNSAGMNTADRNWSGWTQNWAPGLSGPIMGTNDPTLVTKVEFAFLGETAGWWDNIGYRLNGVDKLIASGIQTLPPTTREFGDYWETTLNAGDTLDFFAVGTEKFGPNGIIAPTPNNGGKYYVFDHTLNNIPSTATTQSYFGTLLPLTNTRVVDPLKDLTDQGWTVVAFEDWQVRKNADRDYNDILFAFRAANLQPYGPTVPEPSTYGLIGAAALLALAGYRRFRKA